MELNQSHTQFDETVKTISTFQDQLFRFAFFRTGSLADAQDIVQDVFVTFFKRHQHPSVILNVKHYLLRSIANACTDYQRKKKIRFEQVDTVNQSGFLQEEDASHHLLMIEEYQRIEQLLQHVPEGQAEVIRLRVLDNLGFTEIAELLAEPVTTIKSRFKYGMDKLRVVLHAKKIIV